MKKTVISLCLSFLLVPVYAQKVVSGEDVYGIDVSKYQGKIVTEIDSLNELDFVICKATEGETYTDPDFATNWKLIQDKKLVRGTYHFYHTDDDPMVQAKFFVQTVGKLSQGDMPLIIDIEEGSLSGTTDRLKLQSDLLVFLNYVESSTGRKPMIYTGLSFANAYLQNNIFAGYKLWIAEYTGASHPTLPATWKTQGYIIWQRSQSYKLDSETTDFDLFNGDLQALKGM